MHLSMLANTLTGIDLTDRTNVRLYADEEFGMFEKTEIWRRDVRQGGRAAAGGRRGAEPFDVRTFLG